MASQFGCINCGHLNVQREGDTFTCKKCKHVWTVADEQAMAGYLRMQGREPAKSIFEVEPTSDDAATLTETQGQGGAPTVTPSDPGTPPVVNEQEASGKAEVLPEVPAAPDKSSRKGNKDG